MRIPSDRELYRRLLRDPELRKLCYMEEFERPHHPFQLSRLGSVSALKGLEGIMDNIVHRLRGAGAVKGEIVA